jgi:hypothetical protein
MVLLHWLGDEAAGPGGITPASFVSGALREPSVGCVGVSSCCIMLAWASLARLSGKGVLGLDGFPAGKHIE